LYELNLLTKTSQQMKKLNKPISRVPVLIFCFLALSVGFIIFAISPFAKDNLSLESNQQINTTISETPTPTPVPNKTIKTIVSPTPICSPQSTPVSEQRENPLRDMNLEEYRDLSSGTTDFDCDGVLNSIDNCQSVYNPDQKDTNKDGRGNACDASKVDPSFVDSRCDMDGDGVSDLKDNCPGVCNTDQKFLDINENKVNDLCDPVMPNFVFKRSCSKRVKVKAPKQLKPKVSNNKSENFSARNVEKA
jgi:Thrombospondin type 3 repeat